MFDDNLFDQRNSRNPRNASERMNLQKLLSALSQDGQEIAPSPWQRSQDQDESESNRHHRHRSRIAKHIKSLVNEGLKEIADSLTASANQIQATSQQTPAQGGPGPATDVGHTTHVAQATYAAHSAPSEDRVSATTNTTTTTSTAPTSNAAGTVGTLQNEDKSKDHSHCIGEDKVKDKTLSASTETADKSKANPDSNSMCLTGSGESWHEVSANNSHASSTLMTTRVLGSTTTTAAETPKSNSTADSNSIATSSTASAPAHAANSGSDSTSCSKPDSDLSANQHVADRLDDYEAENSDELFDHSLLTNAFKALKAIHEAVNSDDRPAPPEEPTSLSDIFKAVLLNHNDRDDYEDEEDDWTQPESVRDKATTKSEAQADAKNKTQSKDKADAMVDSNSIQDSHATTPDSTAKSDTRSLWKQWAHMDEDEQDQDEKVYNDDEDVDVALSKSENPSDLIRKLQNEALEAYRQHMEQRNAAHAANAANASDADSSHADTAPHSSYTPWSEWFKQNFKTNDTCGAGADSHEMNEPHNAALSDDYAPSQDVIPAAVPAQFLSQPQPQSLSESAASLHAQAQDASDLHEDEGDLIALHQRRLEELLQQLRKLIVQRDFLQGLSTQDTHFLPDMSMNIHQELKVNEHDIQRLRVMIAKEEAILERIALDQAQRRHQELLENAPSFDSEAPANAAVSSFDPRFDSRFEPFEPAHDKTDTADRASSEDEDKTAQLEQELNDIYQQAESWRSPLGRKHTQPNLDAVESKAKEDAKEEDKSKLKINPQTQDTLAAGETFGFRQGVDSDSLVSDLPFSTASTLAAEIGHNLDQLNPLDQTMGPVAGKDTARGVGASQTVDSETQKGRAESTVMGTGHGTNVTRHERVRYEEKPWDLGLPEQLRAKVRTNISTSSELTDTMDQVFRAVGYGPVHHVTEGNPLAESAADANSTLANDAAFEVYTAPVYEVHEIFTEQPSQEMGLTMTNAGANLAAATPASAHANVNADTTATTQDWTAGANLAANQPNSVATSLPPAATLGAGNLAIPSAANLANAANAAHDALANAADKNARLSPARYQKLIGILDKFITQRRESLIASGLPAEKMLALPLIAVMGSAGAGKSTLCNQLLQEERCKVCAFDVGTTQPEYLYLTVGQDKAPRMCLVDMPGIGVDQAQTDSCLEATDFVLPRSQVVLWVINAQRRDLLSDCQFFTQHIMSKLRPDQQVFILLNQVDNISRLAHWLDEENRPAGDTLEMIQHISSRIADQYNVPESQIIPISAFTGYNALRLLQEIVYSLQD